MSSTDEPNSPDALRRLRRLYEPATTPPYHKHSWAELAKLVEARDQTIRELRTELLRLQNLVLTIFEPEPKEVKRNGE